MSWTRWLQCTLISRCAGASHTWQRLPCARAQIRFPAPRQVLYVLSQPSSAWKGESGHVSREQIKSFLPPPSSSSKMLVSGPPPFMAALSGDKKSPSDQGELVGALRELKYEPSQVFKY